MKKYKIIIKLTDEQEIHASVEAHNQDDALVRLKTNKQVLDFMAESNAKIKSIDIEPIKIQSIDKSRFYVANVKNKKDWYVCADLENRIKVEFKKGHYNDLQNIQTFGEYKPDALATATALREIGDYLATHFKELL